MADIGAATQNETGLKVALRIRPLNDDEIESGATKIAQKVDENMVVLFDPTDDLYDILRAKRTREKQFLFDNVFDADSKQTEVYEKTTRFLIESVISGYNATVFAYGATGAGKTYTMLGTEREPGIMAQTLNDLFHEMESLKDKVRSKVTMSYLEIYNEMIRDLLKPERGVLDLREDAKGDCHVAGLSEVSAKTAKEVMELLQRGNKERTQEPTAANKTSSRSHAVLQVTVQIWSRVRNTIEEVQTAKLFMIDLAGSERASQTKNRGKRMIEGAHINRSLLALGNVINSLSEPNRRGGQYVNYRDSKLTRILKDSLGGNCRTVMIANISPASISFEDSRNTMLYADRARNIKTKVKRNLSNVSYHVAQYTSIINDLRKEIQRLKSKIEQQEINRVAMKSGAKIQEVQNEVQKIMSSEKNELQKLRSELVDNFNERMQARHNLMEVNSSIMEVALEQARHEQTVTEYKSEKNKKFNTTSKDDEDVDVVALAKEELASLEVEKKKLIGYKNEIESKLINAQNFSEKLEETMQKKISSEDQQEVLSLLCKVHELEMECAEMNQHALLQDNLLRQQDLMLERFAQHKHISHEIIQLQKSLLDEHKIPISTELEELYELYQQESEELSQMTKPHISLLPKRSEASETNRVFQTRAGGGIVRIYPNFYVNKQPSLVSLSESSRGDSPGSEDTMTDFIQKKEMILSTKNIAAIAAAKRRGTDSKEPSNRLLIQTMPFNQLSDINEDEYDPYLDYSIDSSSERDYAGPHNRGTYTRRTNTERSTRRVRIDSDPVIVTDAENIRPPLRPRLVQPRKQLGKENNGPVKQTDIDLRSNTSTPPGQLGKPQRRNKSDGSQTTRKPLYNPKTKNGLTVSGFSMPAERRFLRRL